MTPFRKILRDVFYTSSGTFLGLVMAIAKNALIAARFGTGAVYDAFMIATNIPQIISSFSVIGAHNMVPIISKELKAKSEKEAWDTINRVLGFWISVILASTTGAFLIIPFMIHLLAPGFSFPESALSSHFATILIWSSIFSAFSSLAIILSNAYQDFTLSAFVGLVNNAVVFVIVLFFATNDRVDVLPWAVFLGSVAQLLIQYRMMGHLTRYFRFRFRFNDPLFKKIFKLSIPQYIGHSGATLGIAVDRAFASTLATGSVAAISYAMTIYEMPLTIFVIAVNRIYFPIFSRNDDDPNLFSLHARQAIHFICFIVFPLSAYILMMGYPLTQMLFQRGNFNSHSTAITASVLFFFSLGMAIEGFNSLYLSMFNSRQDTLPPMLAGLVRVAFQIAGNILFVPRFGIIGIALATSLALYLKVIFMMIFAEKRLGLKKSTLFDLEVFKIFLASIAIGAVLSGPVYYYKHLSNPGFLQALTILAISFVLGIAVYFSFLLALRSSSILLIRDWGMEFLRKNLRSIQSDT